MTRKAEKEAVKKAIADYIQANELTNTRDVAEGVSGILGFVPSTATVAEVLKELGYVPSAKSRWVYEGK